MHGENSAWHTHLIASPSRARNSHRTLRRFQIHHDQSGSRSCSCRWFRLLIPDVILFTLNQQGRGILRGLERDPPFMRRSIAKITFLTTVVVSIGGWIWLLAVMSKWFILKL